MKKISREDFQDYNNEEYYDAMLQNMDLNHLNKSSYKSFLKDFGNSKEEIGGTMMKKFVRMDRSVLSDFFKQKMKPNNTYVSYIDDFIKENCEKGKDIPLNYVSVLFKKARNSTSMQYLIEKEVLGSRIANLCGVPTVYNNMCSYNGDTYIMSVDFVKDEQTIENLEDTNDSFTGVSGETNFDGWEYYLGNKLNKVISKKNKDKNIIIDRFIKDFVPQFILRNLILDDWDFSPRNIIYIKEKNDNYTNYKLGPSNDYEFILMYRSNIVVRRVIEYNIKYLFNNYPNELNSFMSGLNKRLFKNNQLDYEKLKKPFNHIVENEEIADEMISNIKFRIETIMENYKNLCQNATLDIEHEL